MSARGRIMSPGTSLAVQWLKHHTCTAKGMCSSPGKGTEIPTCWDQPKKGREMNEDSDEELKTMKTGVIFSP